MKKLSFYPAVVDGEDVLLPTRHGAKVMRKRRRANAIAKASRRANAVREQRTRRAKQKRRRYA